MFVAARASLCPTVGGGVCCTDCGCACLTLLPSTCNQAEVKRLIISWSPLSGTISVMVLGNVRKTNNVLYPPYEPLHLFYFVAKVISPDDPASRQKLLLRNTLVIPCSGMSSVNKTRL